ncbi:MAG TPA: hypothetical protein VH479_18595 [Acidimicrobiales bacterium]|jgi:hypothetical protein
MSEADTVTAADVSGRNQVVVARAANLARRVGTGLLVVAALGVTAWAWITLRGLGLLGDSFLGFGRSPSGPGLDDQLDVVVGYMSLLLYSSLVAGTGFGLRLAADYTVSRTGGSLTGLQAGEPLSTDRRRISPFADGGDGGDGEPYGEPEA